MANSSGLDNLVPWYDSNNDFKDLSNFNMPDISEILTVTPATTVKTPVMPPPPTDQQFPSLNEAMKAINNFTRAYGYTLISQRSKADKETGEKKTVYLRCDRGGKFIPKVNDDARIKSRTSRCVECPFSAVLDYNIVSGWGLRIRELSHNHDPSLITTHPSLRHDELVKKQQQIEAQLYLGTPAHKILEVLKKEDLETSIKPQDIHNLCQILHRKFLDGCTLIQALLTILPEEGKWIFNWRADHHVPVPEAGDDFEESAMITAMPLLNIVGHTATGGTFYIGFTFIQDEKQNTYKFVLNCLRDVYDKLNLVPPRTVLVDKDKALINALKQVFPETNVMLCIWHINHNFLAKARPMIRKELVEIHSIDDPNFDKQVHEKWQQMQHLWMKVVNTATIQEKNEIWREFKQEYSDELYQPVVDYLESEWLEPDTA
ncbi:hypothetical protein VTN00DRAFT_8606 [Thermoascus crustaceus]|uniref:uncharacterized protein n=1 Tax=Thermoascus crustaceus TaxID=5088 RepID=UPI00374261E2